MLLRLQQGHQPLQSLRTRSLDQHGRIRPNGLRQALQGVHQLLRLRKSTHRSGPAGGAPHGIRGVHPRAHAPQFHHPRRTAVFRNERAEGVRLKFALFHGAQHHPTLPTHGLAVECVPSQTKRFRVGGVGVVDDHPAAQRRQGLQTHTQRGQLGQAHGQKRGIRAQAQSQQRRMNGVFHQNFVLKRQKRLQFLVFSVKE